MLIQCQSCSTKYRLNLERMPQRKTFVRCKACGTPIYIDPQGEEPPPEAAVIPPVAVAQHEALSMHVGRPEAPGGALVFTPLAPKPVAAPEGVAVQCPACDARYRVPAQPLQRQGIKLKCTRCGHVFVPPVVARTAFSAAPLAAPPPGAAQVVIPPSAALAPPAGQDGWSMPDLSAPMPEGMGESVQSAPSPADAAVDLEAPALDPFPSPDAAEDPEQAYLHAVSLEGEEAGGAAGSAAGSERMIPDRLRHQLFLSPERFQAGTGAEPAGTAAAGAAARSPAMYGDLPQEELPDLEPPAGPPGHEERARPGFPEAKFPAQESPEAQSPEEESLELPSGADDLPPLETMPLQDLPLQDLPLQDLPLGDLPGLSGLDGEPAGGAAELEADQGMDQAPPPPPGGPRRRSVRPEDLPPLPALILQRPSVEPPGKTVEVPGQWTRLSEPRRLALLGLAIAAVVALAVGWGVWLFQQPQLARAFAVESEGANLLALQSNLETRYVVNQPSGRTLFVVQGAVENDYPASRRISWVRLRGMLYADRGQSRSLGNAYVYPGNVLEQRQLETMPLSAVLAYGSYNNGRGNENYHLLPQAQVPFQLVFQDVSDPVARTVVQVVSYYRDGLSVFLEGPLLGE